MDFLVATGFVLAFVGMSWAYGRFLSGGRALNRFKRRLLTFASLFAGGMIYLMLLVSVTHWPKQILFVLIAFLGAALGLAAWLRYRNEH